MTHRLLYLLLMLGSSVLANAQSSWRSAADSSGSYLAKRDYANAYNKGLQAALMYKPVQQADSVWTAVVGLARQLPDSVAGSTLLLAGKYYFDQNEADKARLYLEKAAEEGQRYQRPNQYLRSYLLTARIELRNRAYARAMRLYQRVLGDTGLEQCMNCNLETWLGLTDVYLATAQFDSATATARQALAFVERQPDFKRNIYYPMVRLQLSMCAYVAGDLTKSLQEAEESYSVARISMPNNPYLIAIGRTYAMIISDINDEKALEATRTARRLLERQPNYSQNPYYLPLLNNEVGLLRSIDRNDQAVLLADSVLLRHPMDELLKFYGFDAFLSQINRTYITARRTAEVEKIAAKALDLMVTKEYGGADPTFLYRILGRYYQYKRNFSEAVRCLHEEIRLDSVGKEISYINHSLKNRLAVCQAEAGQRTDAYASFSRLVQEFDDNVRTNLWLMSDAERDNYLATTGIVGIFWHLIRPLNPQPEEVGLAYNYKLLQQGVRIKMNRTINQFAHTRNQADSSLATVRQLISMRTRLADPNLANNPSDQRQLVQAADSLERMMGKDAITLNQATKTARWQDVRAKLKPGEAAVELVRYTNFSQNGQPFDSIAYSAFLVRPEWAAPKIIQLPTPDDETRERTNEELAFSRTAEHYINDVFSRQSQEALFKNFWQPIATALGPVNRLYIALDGGYQGLSLPTIQNPRTGRYLADDLEIVVLNSTQDILEELRTSTSRVAELVGHPAYTLMSRPTKQPRFIAKRTRQIKTRNGLTFEELPYTRIEVQQLGKLFKSYNLKPQERIDEAASEVAFQQMQSPRILHVATHGYLRLAASQTASGQLLTCGLVLAGAADTVLLTNQTDGILTGYEASLLNLHDTELVTLSACETGIGDYFEGEGVNGLQRAFLLAGAKSVLMSLWKVNDELTQQLMTDFYRYWLAGMTKPQALRKAQANLRRQHPNPYYWGAFVLLGQ